MKIDFEKVLADYGLKVGDKVNVDEYSQYNPYTINYNEIRGFELVTLQRTYLYIQALLECHWEKVEPKKTVGDLSCGDTVCPACPLTCLCCAGNATKTIKENLIKTLEIYPELEPMREYIEAELDKEVEE